MVWITASEQSSQVFLLMSPLRLKGLLLPMHAASCTGNRYCHSHANTLRVYSKLTMEA